MTQECVTLTPGRIVDIGTRGAWKRDYRNSRRWFKSRHYYRGVRVPWLAWVMFASGPTRTITDA